MRSIVPICSNALVVAGLLFTTTAASAGAYMEMADKDLVDTKAPTKTSKIWAQDGKIRLDMAADNTSVIFKDQTMYALDHKQKRATVIDKATMDKAASQMAAARQQMEARMAQLSPEQRAQAEKMMGEHGGMGKAPARTLKETSKTESLNGIPCKVWDVTEGTKKTQELCVAPTNAIAGGAEMLASFKSLASLFEGMKNQMGGDRMSQAWSDFDQIKGVPIITRELEEGKAIREHRLVTSRAEPVSAASFSPPTDYKVEKPNFGAQHNTPAAP